MPEITGTAHAPAASAVRPSPDEARDDPADVGNGLGNGLGLGGTPGAREQPRRRRVVAALVAVASGVLFASATPPIDVLLGIPLGLVGFAWALSHLPRTGAPTNTAPPVVESTTTAPNETRNGENASRSRSRSSRTKRPKRAPGQAWMGASLGWLFGWATNVVALRFVPEVVMRFTPLPAIAAWTALLLLAMAQALPWAVAGAIARVVTTRAFEVGERSVVRFAPALAFAFGVYLATFVPSIFPWTPAGGLAPWPVLLQTAEVVGERGTTFLLAFAAGLFAESITRAMTWTRAKRAAGAGDGANSRGAFVSAGLGTLIVVVMLSWGAFRMRSVNAAREAAPRATIALVQPGFDASDRWEPSRATMMLDRLTTLTKSAESRGASLTIWPESAYPYTLPHTTRRSPVGAHAILQPEVRGPVLTGAYMSGGGGVGYNSAIVATADGAITKPYDKRHLLWFGETIPFADSFPWIRKVFARGSGLVPGTESVAFVVGPVRAAVLNCYEDTLPQAGREAMEIAPNLLVNITNDAWFAGSAEGELHLRLATLRAIEARRDLVRAVNRGPTSFVDATGRVRARYEQDMAATLHVTPALLETPPTLFTRFGDAPLVLVVAASLTAAVVRRRALAATPR